VVSELLREKKRNTKTNRESGQKKWSEKKRKREVGGYERKKNL